MAISSLTLAEQYDSTDTLQGSFSYHYNPDGQLVARTDNMGSSTEHYVYSGSQRVLQLDDNETVRHRYLWNPGGDDLLADLVFDAAGQFEKNLWAATDHLGSVRQLVETGTSAAVVEHREYDSYGAVDEVFDAAGTEINPSAMQSTVAHTGSFYEADLGLYNKRARWYDPEVGRFLGEDPTGHADGPNPYLYAGNDPVNFYDPTGLCNEFSPLGNVYDSIYTPINTGLTTEQVLGLNSYSSSYSNPFDYSLNSVSTAINYIKDSSGIMPTAVPMSRSALLETPQERKESYLRAQVAAIDERLARANGPFHNMIEMELRDIGQRHAIRNEIRNSVEEAAARGLFEPGSKSIVNATVGTVTFGFVDDPIPASDFDLSAGYGWSRGFASIGTETTFGLLTGGLSQASRLGKVLLGADVASNVRDVGMGLYDAYKEGGLTVSNTLQIAGGLFGGVSNVAGARRVSGPSRSASHSVQYDAGRVPGPNPNNLRQRAVTTPTAGGGGVYLKPQVGRTKIGSTNDFRGRYGANAPDGIEVEIPLTRTHAAAEDSAYRWSARRQRRFDEEYLDRITPSNVRYRDPSNPKSPVDPEK